MSDDWWNKQNEILLGFHSNANIVYLCFSIRNKNLDEPKVIKSPLKWNQFNLVDKLSSLFLPNKNLKVIDFV